MTPPRSLLFVCLGNICRSPLAEGIFLHLAEQRGVAGDFTVDSAGTGHWHIGERPDRRASQVASRYQVILPSIARQVDPASDFDQFDLILPMDLDNRRDLLGLGAPPSKVRLMRSFDVELAGAPDAQLVVPDPYFGDGDGFERVFAILRQACDGLLDELLE